MAAAGRIFRLEINTTGTPGPQGRIHRLEIDAAVHGPEARIHRLELASPKAVSAGVDQLNLEPGTTINLVGTGGDASIVTQTWTQTAGTTCAITQSGANATVKLAGAVAGETFTFRYTVNGAYDDVQASTLRVTEMGYAGGVLSPIVIMSGG